jgi:hypothetical protein
MRPLTLEIFISSLTFVSSLSPSPSDLTPSRSQDPGPWLIGVPSASLPLALADLSPEVVLVDLDNNAVTCSQPASNAVTTGAMRDKARRRLEAAIGDVGRYGVSAELVEAFPSGRFRPFSTVEVAGEPREAERLVPSWEVRRSVSPCYLELGSLASSAASDSGRSLSSIRTLFTYRPSFGSPFSSSSLARRV